MSRIKKRIELEFTVLEFYRNHVLSKPKEGQILGPKQVSDLVEICSGYYEGAKFVYLSHRVNDYNVNPTIYLNLDKVRNLAGIGIVSTRTSSLSMANFEKKFSKLPYEVFTHMDDALEWVEELLKK